MAVYEQQETGENLVFHPEAIMVTVWQLIVFVEYQR